MGSRQNAWVVARSHTHEGMSWLGLRISAWDMMFKIVCLEKKLGNAYKVPHSSLSKNLIKVNAYCLLQKE